MTAETYGEKLLADVKEEKLSEILRDVRPSGLRDSDIEARHSYLGIKPLDDLLQIFFQPSDHQYQAEEHHDGQRHDVSSSTERTRPVIEVTSPSSGDGKTSLLYYITAIGILPQSFDGVTISGKSGAVVFVDTDSRFDARRLRDILLCIVREKLGATEYGRQSMDTNGQTGLELMVDECLRHVHVFRPQSSLALLSTLRSIESYLLHSSQHLSNTRRLHAIILDSASAFYWQDRRETELLNIPGIHEERAAAGTSQRRADATQGSGLANMNTSQKAQEIVSALRHLQHTFSCAVLYSTWGLQRAHSQYKPQNRPYGTASSGSSSPMSFHPHLPRPWPTFPTVRLVIRRDGVRQFASHMSIDEARREAAARQGIVARGDFSLWVDPWGKNSWAPDIAERVSSHNVLTLSVTGVGVRIYANANNGNISRT